MNEQINFDKPFKLTVEAPLMDKKGKVFEPGIYGVGELSQELMKPIYGHNMDSIEDTIKKEPEGKREDKPVIKPAA